MPAGNNNNKPVRWLMGNLSFSMGYLRPEINQIPLIMDRYDKLILLIIQNYKDKSTDRSKIRLDNLERTFWKRVEDDDKLQMGGKRIGERITNLYLDGLIENKNGYSLTRKGKSELKVLHNSIIN